MALFGQNKRFLNYSSSKADIVKINKNINSYSAEEKPFIYYKTGQFFVNNNLEDKAYFFFTKAREGFKQNDNPYAYDAGLYLHKISTTKKGANIDSTNIFLKEFEANAAKEKSRLKLAIAYSEWTKVYLKKYIKNKTNLRDAFNTIDKALLYVDKADSLELKSELLLVKGVIYAVLNKNNEAKGLYQQSLQLSETIDDDNGVINACNNLGKLYENENNIAEAEKYYKQAELVKPKKFAPVSYRILYFNFKSLYERKNDEKLYTKYSLKYDSIENIIKENQQIANIAGIEINSNKKEISSLKKLTESYQENKILYFILIGLVFLIAMYSFIRWKKVDYRRRKLTEEKESLQIEHNQTIRELEKVKQLVIEDHIVLKNKAKVYLNELIYIKAEDHYLQLITSKKKEFVRGKISEIVNELPPNFVQTHRSYIVNRNLITSQTGNSVFLEGKIEIPLSRNFKKNII